MPRPRPRPRARRARLVLATVVLLLPIAGSATPLSAPLPTRSQASKPFVLEDASRGPVAPEPSWLLAFVAGLLTGAVPIRLPIRGVTTRRGGAENRAEATLGSRPRAKRFVDVAGASIGLLLAAPVIALAACAIRLTSPGPIFFGQTRCGRDGRVFTMWKLRSMRENAESMRETLQDRNVMDGPVFKVPDDPRVTRVGRFLRRFSIDELPQFWNVLRGEMSLVGPRPPLPDEVARYGPRARRRLSVTPGLTCVWQVSGRNEISFDQWVDMDLDYIDNWSLSRDLVLMVRTVPALLSGRGSY